MLSSNKNIKFESINLGTIGVKKVSKSVSKIGIKTVQMGSCEVQVTGDLSSQKPNLLPTNPWGKSVTESTPVVETVVETVIETVIDPVLEPVLEPVVEPVLEPVLVPVAEPASTPVTKSKMSEAQYQKKLAKKNLKKAELEGKERLYQKELSMKVDQANIVAQKAYDAAYEVNFIEYPKKEALAKSEEVRKLAFEKELARLLPPAPVSEVKVSVAESISSETDDGECFAPPPSPVVKKVAFNPILPSSMIPASEVDLSSFTPVNGSKSKKEVDYKTSLLNARELFAKSLVTPHLKMIQAKFTQPSTDEKESFYFINVNTSTNDVLGKFQDTSFTKSKFMQNIKFAFSKYLARELETLTNLKLWVTIKKNALEEHKYSVYLKLKR